MVALTEQSAQHVDTQRIDRVREIFREYMRSNQLRQTPERFAVLDEVYSSEDHFDADELYMRLKMKDVQVSRATVYNTLKREGFRRKKNATRR